jgi:hypothetical protein
MDASVGLPLVDSLAIPPSVAQVFPFLVSPRPTSFSARLYACTPAVLMTCSPATRATSDQQDSTAADSVASHTAAQRNDDASLVGYEATGVVRVEPRDVLICVSYHALFVCDLLTSSVCGVVPFGSSLSSWFPSMNGSAKSSVPQLHAIVTAQDDESWIVFQARSSREGSSSDVLVQIPALGQRTKVLAAVSAMAQHHAKALDRKIVPQASELRIAWETSQIRKWKVDDTSQHGSDTVFVGLDIPTALTSNRVARQLLCPLQARWVLNRRGVPLVADRMKQARDEYQTVEDATNAALSEIERDFDRLFGQLDSRFANLSVEDNVLSQWDRELDDKEARRMIAEAELRRAKDAARQIAHEKERTIVRCTEELQSWRKILSEKQHEELREREALMADERRIQLAKQDGLRVLEELKNEISVLEDERADYAAADYVALVEDRDAALQQVKNAQLDLEAFETDVVPTLKKKLAEAQKKISKVTATNEALRKLLHTTELGIASCVADDADLKGDQQSIANDVVALEDALLLVDLEYAQARRERDTVKEACAEADARTNALISKASQGGSAERLDDPTARYRVAKLRMGRARKEQQGAELLANRAQSVHRSGTCELQQQILFEAIRLKSPSAASHDTSSPANRNGIHSNGSHVADDINFGDEELDAMLHELLS